MTQIKKSFTLLSLFALLFIISTNANAQKYTASDMPSAVLETFHKMYPNATAIGYDIEKENGTKYYEIESKEGERKTLCLIFRTIHKLSKFVG